MDNNVKHKLRVFISSKCGGKYAIARKALQKLLESTGLIEAYVFENEPASSEDTKSAYLDYVDNSNLCVFLIDNADGIPPAVLSEEKRAKEKQLRLLYLFCDESKKEQTPTQKTIKDSLSHKYRVVHEFADIVPTAYDSVLQDLIAVYKRKEGNLTPNANDIEIATDKKSYNIERYTLPHIVFSQFPKTCNVLLASINIRNSTVPNPGDTTIENLLSEHLKIVLFQRQFDTETICNISNEVIGIHPENMREILSFRFDAQKKYYNCEYEECLQLLQNALRTAIDCKHAPEWIANDIAIDIRHVFTIINEHNNQFSTDNPGQKYIDQSDEPVYYPYLDRQVENMYEEVARKYNNQLTLSPYTVQIGGIDRMFIYLANAFCIAEIHGSIVQTEITRNRLITIYSMLCAFYKDHNLLIEYLRLAIVNRSADVLDTIIRAQNQLGYDLNGNDVNNLLNSVDNIKDNLYCIESKYLLISRLGYYMETDVFESLSKEMFDNTLKWIDKKCSPSNISKYIFDFLEMVQYRLKSEDIAAIICKVLEHEYSLYYRDCFIILEHIDYSALQKSTIQHIKQCLMCITSEKNRHILDFTYCNAVIHFCKSSNEPIDDLEALLSQTFPSWFLDTFLLEMNAFRKQDLSAFIHSNLNEASSRNKMQGINGTYQGYVDDNFSTIYNIILFTGLSKYRYMLNDIIKAIIDTLSAEKQTIKAKRNAFMLLQLLYLEDKSADIWETVVKQIEENSSSFSSGSMLEFFSKENSSILVFQQELFLSNFDETRNDWLIEKVMTFNKGDSYNQIQILKIIYSFLQKTDDKSINPKVLLAFLYFCIGMSRSNENDVHYNATQCLLELTKFEQTKQIALMYLLQIMDYGSSSDKILIVSRIKQIQPDDPTYKELIVNKGKADNNYLVRSTTQKAIDFFGGNQNI